MHPNWLLCSNLLIILAFIGSEGLNAGNNHWLASAFLGCMRTPFRLAPYDNRGIPQRTLSNQVPEVIPFRLLLERAPHARN